MLQEGVGFKVRLPNCKLIAMCYVTMGIPLQFGYHISTFGLKFEATLQSKQATFFLKAFLTIFFRILVMCSTERLTFCLRVLLAFCHPVLAKRFCCSVLIAKHAHAIANCMRKRRNNTIIYCSIGQGNMNI